MTIKMYCRNCDTNLEAPVDMQGEIVECPECDDELEVPFRKPSKVRKEGQPRKPKPLKQRKKRTKRKNAKTFNMRVKKPEVLGFVPNYINLFLALIGALVVLIGVFCPVVSIPDLGNVTFFRVGGKFAYFMMGFAAFSFPVTAIAGIFVKKMYRCNIALGAFILVNLGIAFALMCQLMYGTSAVIVEQYLSSYQMVSEAESFQWGWIVLLVAGILLMASGIVNSKKPIKQEAADI